MRNRLHSRYGYTTTDTDSDLLLEGVFDSNIDRETPGAVRIALWREWSPMLEDLRGIGPVWSVVRNGHCVLSVHGDYPKLALTSDQQSGSALGEKSSLNCHFRAWRQAIAFDSRCCCGRVCGLDIENWDGLVFHRICLSPGSNPAPFAEWIQTHQATGLEEDGLDDERVPLDRGRFHPQSFAPVPGTLQALPQTLRPLLIKAAEREIPLAAGVLSEGVTQTSLLEIERASEAQGWLVLAAPRSSLYVESEPRGSLHVEPVTIEGERSWRLSLVAAEGVRVLSLQPGVEGRESWNQLVTDVVLRR